MRTFVQSLVVDAPAVAIRKHEPGGDRATIRAPAPPRGQRDFRMFLKIRHELQKTVRGQDVVIIEPEHVIRKFSLEHFIAESLPRHIRGAAVAKYRPGNRVKCRERTASSEVQFMTQGREKVSPGRQTQMLRLLPAGFGAAFRICVGGFVGFDFREAVVPPRVPE